ncbi:MAG: type II secretion system F family protein [Nocardioidaceae bacterium]|nr:type II secretion system F family protein [Nocardioidaceae bacterium]
MLMLFILGFGLVATAILLVSMAVRPETEATGINRSIAVLEAMTNAPSELTKDLDQPFSERVLDPLLKRFLGIGRRLSGADTGERIHRKLELAGNPPGWTVDRIVSAKVLAGAGGFVISLLFAFLINPSSTTKLVIVAAGVMLGYFAPNMFLYQRSYDRQNQIQKGLADAIDLLTISVESGLGFDAALQQVSRNTTGPLAEEFARVLSEMQIGQGRNEALRSLSERTNLPELKSFVSALAQADAFGIPIGAVLRVQSTEMRTKRRQRAEEKAQQVPVKITIPLIFCILPCLFIAVMGPAAISMLHNFRQ